MRSWIILTTLAVALFAGCLDGAESNGKTAAEKLDFPYYNVVDGKYHFEWKAGDNLMHYDWAPGLDGKIWNKGTTEVTVSLPANSILINVPETGAKSFALAEPSFTLGPNEQVFFLASPMVGNVTVKVETIDYVLDPTTTNDYAVSTRQFVSGENVIELSKYQEANFPHRTPGQPNYATSIEYFAKYFDDLGYDVEVDPYGFVGSGSCVQTPLGPICPESLSNIVATKVGTTNPEKVIFVSGGHYDMVPGTTHAAFDNTGGSVSTMELARALAPYEFAHTIKFALWGGEENGILGSQFWVQSNPTAKLDVLSYVNLDVVGMSWPAPIVKPDPVLIAAGIDVPGAGNGQTLDPISQNLLNWMENLQANWFGFPSEFFIYEGIASGQLTGYAGVNAQSDHTPFAAAGIPAYFIFNGDALAGDNPIRIHSERDTLENMTKYSLFGNDFDLDVPGFNSVAEQSAAEAALAASFETTLYFPLYHAILTDLGVYSPPGVQAVVPSVI